MTKIFNNLFFLIIILALGFSSCKDADQIRKRAKAVAASTVKFVKVVTPNSLGAIHKVTTDKFLTEINKKEGTLIDVRTPEEFAEGHLEGAVNVNFKKRTFPSFISAIDKNKPTYIYCRSANRSGKAALIMQSLGFKTIYDLDGGFKAWNKAGLKVVTTDTDTNVKLQAALKAKAPTPMALSSLGEGIQVEENEFEKLVKSGDVTLVDVRKPDEFAEGFIDGAVNIDWKNRHFAKNILAVSNDKPVAIYCRSGNRATRAMYAMRALGFTKVYNLKHGIKSWKAAQKPLRTLEVKGDIRHLDVANFQNAILGKVGNLIDVRTPKEWTDFHIPGAGNIDFKNSNFKAEFAKLDKKEPVLIYCRSGKRSGRAMKVLEGMGFKVYNLDNGILDWKANGMKLEGKNIAKKDGGEEGC